MNYRAAERDAVEVAAEVERGGRRALVVRADVARAAGTASLAEAGVRAFGHVDCW